MKKTAVWLMVVLGLLGVAAGYYGIYVMIAHFASGLVWWGEVLLLVGGPVSQAGALLALKNPRQRLAAAVGYAGFGLWVILWVLCFTVLGFRFHSANIEHLTAADESEVAVSGERADENLPPAFPIVMPVVRSADWDKR